MLGLLATFRNRKRCEHGSSDARTSDRGYLCSSVQPELSDLIVDYDPDTLARRPVTKAAVLARLTGTPHRVAARLATMPSGDLDPAEMDGVLVRAHLELQRLHEEFRVPRTVGLLLKPMIEHVRQTRGGPIRVVDLGCGLGFVLRWLARHGELGEDVELVGADYNRALVEAASTLAREDELRCRFLTANAFRLSQPADIVLSTGVVHHFRDDDLVRLFREHEASAALGFVHVDIRPSILAPIGSLIFHVSRMREPLAKFDGYWSAVRAHPVAALVDASTRGAPIFAHGTFDSTPGLFGLVRIFHALVGLRGSDLAAAYAPLGKRFAPA